MIKKSTSTSNVPNSNNSGNIQQSNQTYNTPPKMKNTHKNHSNQSNSSEIINSKHLHNHSYPQKPKKMKETTVNDGNNENILMKKLFEAVQKQKEKEIPRKATAAPLPKTMNSSETYAGAAFDRAPAATSFPIPSFLKPGNNEKSGCSPALSSSCPLPGFIETAQEKSEKSEKKKLESLTNDLRRMLNLR